MFRSTLIQGGHGAKSSIFLLVAFEFNPKSTVLAVAPCFTFAILPDGTVVSTLESTFLVVIADL